MESLQQDTWLYHNGEEKMGILFHISRWGYIFDGGKVSVLICIKQGYQLREGGRLKNSAEDMEQV
jgi:hypothetical protein